MNDRNRIDTNFSSSLFFSPSQSILPSSYPLSATTGMNTTNKDGRQNARKDRRGRELNFTIHFVCDFSFSFSSQLPSCGLLSLSGWTYRIFLIDGGSGMMNRKGVFFFSAGDANNKYEWHFFEVMNEVSPPSVEPSAREWLPGAVAIYKESLIPIPEARYAGTYWLNYSLLVDPVGPRRVIVSYQLDLHVDFWEKIHHAARITDRNQPSPARVSLDIPEVR